MLWVLKYFEKEQKTYSVQHLEYYEDKREIYVVTLKDTYFEINRN